MSLVGNLADLGLADIFQIVSLSRRSGTLQLSTQLETGEIIFLDGRVVAAFRSGAEWTVGDLLLESKIVAPITYQEMLAAQSRGMNGLALAKQFAVDLEGWDSCLKDMLADIVYAMFEWDDGTFSFVLEQQIDPWRGFALGASRAVVSHGVNPQYLAMEGARRRDERQKSDSLSQFLRRENPPPADDDPMVFAHAQLDEPGRGDRSSDLEPATEAAREPEPAKLPAELTPPPPPTPPSKVIPFPKRREEAAPRNEPPLSEIGSAAPERALNASTGWSLLVLDDDPNVLRVLNSRFRSRFAKVLCAERVADAMARLREHDGPVVVVADVLLPRSDGRGILGGIELAERLRAEDPERPILLFSDYNNEVAEERAHALRISGVLAKPRRSQILRSPRDPRPSEQMEAFLGALRLRLEPYLGEEQLPDDSVDLSADLAEDIGAIVDGAGVDLPPRPAGAQQIELLRSMLAELVNPANRETVTLLVLRYADLVAERAALFLVTRDAYIGLGGFRAGEDSEPFVARVRKTHVPTDAGVVFDRAVKYNALIRGPLDPNPVNRALVERLGGPGQAEECFVAPLASGGRVAAVLYGDNPSGQPLGPTDGLEIFLQQAGLAMDRALLERRLEESKRQRD